MIAAFTLNVSIDRRYVVSGSAMNKVNRVIECEYTPGGKGLNLARVVSALGRPLVACGIAGGDAGRYIERRLSEAGIPHRFTAVAAESRSCINIYDEKTCTQTEYLEPGFPITEEEQARFFRDFEDIIKSASVVTLSGSLPKGMPADTYAKLVATAKAAGKPVLLDTSGAALEKGIAAAPYFIKPNEDEIAALTGCDPADEAAIIAAAKKLHESGIERVVVSMGERGALLACSEGVFRGVPPKIQPVNTVGCGDSMSAAFAVAAMEGMSAAESLRFAVGVSCASALHPATGGLSKQQLDSVLPLVQVCPV